MDTRFDLTGLHFGRWSVLSLAGREGKGALLWLCECQCGTQKPVSAKALRNGRSQSCGCLHRDLLSKRTSQMNRERAPSKQPGYVRPTCKEDGCDRQAEGLGWCKMHYKRFWRHGDTRPTKTGHAALRTPTYVSWTAMRRRCRETTGTHWKYYGARGITVCERWNDFRNFLADMGERPAGTSIERINNDIGYSPDNCRWATPKEQIANRRRWGKRLHEAPTESP